MAEFSFAAVGSLFSDSLLDRDAFKVSSVNTFVTIKPTPIE